MNRISCSRIRLGLVAVTLAAAGVGCGDDLTRPSATIPNVIDTTTLFALSDTPVGTPSAYDLLRRSRARPEMAEPFDFGVNIADNGTLWVLPAGVLGIEPPQAGVQLAELPFDSVVRAPEDGYVQDDSVTVPIDGVFIARSRADNTGCLFLGSLPRYGKFRVLALDSAARSVTLELLVDVNCGFRGLEPGIPTS